MGDKTLSSIHSMCDIINKIHFFIECLVGSLLQTKDTFINKEESEKNHIHMMKYVKIIYELGRVTLGVYICV